MTSQGYNAYMMNKYRQTITTVSFINYHFVFCPRYRRKIFKIPGVEQRFREITALECARNNIDVICMECYEDHVYLLVSVLPSMSIANIMRRIKKATSVQLKSEFSQLSGMSNLWTRNYLVSTENSISIETIEWYVGTQAKTASKRQEKRSAL